MPEIGTVTWSVLKLQTLKTAAKDVLGVEVEKRTLKSAYAEAFDALVEKVGEENLKFTCRNCGSRIDAEIPKCWACDLVFTDEYEEDDVVDSELVERAKRLGIEVGDLGREDLIERIEAEETRRRADVKDLDLLTLESKRLNEKLTEAMPDGWCKKRAKQYTTYFDGKGTRRICVFHRGLRVQFSIENGFFDGFADLTFYDADERRAKHFGRVNYEYQGDTGKYALDLSKRVFEEY